MRLIAAWCARVLVLAWRCAYSLRLGALTARVTPPPHLHVGMDATCLEPLTLPAPSPPACCPPRLFPQGSLLPTLPAPSTAACLPVRLLPPRLPAAPLARLLPSLSTTPTPACLPPRLQRQSPSTALPWSPAFPPRPLPPFTHYPSLARFPQCQLHLNAPSATCCPTHTCCLPTSHAVPLASNCCPFKPAVLRTHRPRPHLLSPPHPHLFHKA